MATYMTDEEFAQNKGYDNWADFAKKEAFPKSQTLKRFRERMYAIINKYIGSAVTKDDFLMNLEFQGVKMMITEAQAEMSGEPRDFYMPHDYLYERDRRILDSYDRTLNRGVTSG